MPRQASAAHPVAPPGHRAGAPRRSDAHVSRCHAGSCRRRGKPPAPRGTPQRAFPSATVCASCTGLTAGRARRSLLRRIARNAVPLIQVVPYIHERSPDALARKAARCQETACGRRYSVPVPAGGTTGSLCVWMHARGCRLQPRNGPGEIADAANGLDDGLACLQPTGGLILLQPKPYGASAPLSWAEGSCTAAAGSARAKPDGARFRLIGDGAPPRFHPFRMCR